MNPPLTYCLEQIAKSGYSGDRPTVPEIITLGSDIFREFNERLSYYQQILIHAIEAPESIIQSHIESICDQIKSQFVVISPTHQLAYPYDDIDAMKIVVEGLIQHFNGSISYDKVLTKIYKSKKEEKAGYIIITIINMPYIS